MFNNKSKIKKVNEKQKRKICEISSISVICVQKHHQKKGGITSAFFLICKLMIKRTLQQLLRKALADPKSVSAH